jgi:hypothetical protein
MLQTTFDLSQAAQIIGALDIIEKAEISPLCGDLEDTPSRYAAEYKKQIYDSQPDGLVLCKVPVTFVFELYNFFNGCMEDWGDYGPCSGGLLDACMHDCIYVLINSDKKMNDMNLSTIENHPAFMEKHKSLLV